MYMDAEELIHLTSFVRTWRTLKYKHCGKEYASTKPALLLVLYARIVNPIFNLPVSYALTYYVFISDIRCVFERH